MRGVVTYLQAEDFQHSIDNMPMTMIQRTFRQSIHQKTMRFTFNNDNNYLNSDVKSEA